MRMFGQQLSAAREGRGISQAQLDAEAGLQYGAVSKLERAVEVPDLLVVLRFSSAEAGSSCL
jgi:transcriptional regulator with XRE-family HTH domain